MTLSSASEEDDDVVVESSSEEGDACAVWEEDEETGEGEPMIRLPSGAMCGGVLGRGGRSPSRRSTSTKRLTDLLNDVPLTLLGKEKRFQSIFESTHQIIARLRGVEPSGSSVSGPSLEYQAFMTRMMRGDVGCVSAEEAHTLFEEVEAFITTRMHHQFISDLHYRCLVDQRTTRLNDLCHHFSPSLPELEGVVLQDRWPVMCELLYCTISRCCTAKAKLECILTAAQQVNHILAEADTEPLSPVWSACDPRFYDVLLLLFIRTDAVTMYVNTEYVLMYRTEGLCSGEEKEILPYLRRVCSFFRTRMK